MNQSAEGVAAPDRLPPHSVEAEQGVLGSILLEPKECMALALEQLGTDPAVFYDLRHQVLYRVMIQLDGRDLPVEMVMMMDALRTQGLLEDAGGIAYLSSLPEAVPSAANFEHYANLVSDKAQRRRMLQEFTNLYPRVEYGDAPGIEDLMAEVETRISAVATPRGGGAQTDIKTIVKVLMDEIADSVEHRNHDGLTKNSVRCGIPIIDKRLTGFVPGLIVLGARPSCGKTSLICTWIVNIAIHDQRPVTFQSLEMSAKEIVMRLWCIMADVCYRKVRSGFIDKAGQERMIATGDKLAKAPIYIDDAAGLTPAAVRARGLRLVRKHGSVIHFIDHMSEISDPAHRGDARRDATAATRAIRSIAKSAGIPVVAACQLNREADGREQVSAKDFRDSGEIEQAMDVGIILKRNEQEEERALVTGWNPKDEHGNEIERIVTAWVVKQRNGPTGPCHLKWHMPSMRFYDASPEGRGSLYGN